MKKNSAFHLNGLKKLLEEENLIFMLILGYARLSNNKKEDEESPSMTS